MTAYSEFYLQDGQTESNVSLWRKRLREAPTEVLSVCAWIEEQDARARDGLRTCSGMLSAPLHTLSGILSAVEGAMRQMPQSAGFFPSAEERRAAFWRVCHFLTSLESAANRLREEAGGLLQLWERVRSGMLARMQNECILRHILLAAEEETAEEILTSVRRALQKNEQIRQDVSHFDAVFGDACRLFGKEAEEDRRAFCDRIAKASDLEHAGQDASPSRVLQALEEYKRTLLRKTEEGRTLLEGLEEA